MITSNQSAATVQADGGQASSAPASQPFNISYTAPQSGTLDGDAPVAVPQLIAPIFVRRMICSVCAVPKTFVPLGQAGVSDFPRQNLTPRCDHEPTVCVECVVSWLGTQLEYKGCGSICCPQCPNTFGTFKRSATNHMERNLRFTLPYNSELI